MAKYTLGMIIGENMSIFTSPKNWNDSKYFLLFVELKEIIINKPMLKYLKIISILSPIVALLGIKNIVYEHNYITKNISIIGNSDSLYLLSASFMVMLCEWSLLTGKMLFLCLFAYLFIILVKILMLYGKKILSIYFSTSAEYKKIVIEKIGIQNRSKQKIDIFIYFIVVSAILIAIWKFNLDRNKVLGFGILSVVIYLVISESIEILRYFIAIKNKKANMQNIRVLLFSKESYIEELKGIVIFIIVCSYMVDAFILIFNLAEYKIDSLMHNMFINTIDKIKLSEALKTIGGGENINILEVLKNISKEKSYGDISINFMTLLKKDDLKLLQIGVFYTTCWYALISLFVKLVLWEMTRNMNTAKNVLRLIFENVFIVLLTIGISKLIEQSYHIDVNKIFGINTVFAIILGLLFSKSSRVENMENTEKIVSPSPSLAQAKSEKGQG